MESGSRLKEDLQGNVELIELNVGNNFGLGPGGIGEILEGLRKCGKLEILNISCTGIGETLSPGFIQKLQAIRSVRCLDLGYNNIGNEGSAVFAKGLEGHRLLESLNL